MIDDKKGRYQKKVLARKSSDNSGLCFIVEGHTEENYITLLNNYFGKKYRVYNCKGGGANGVLDDAIKFISENEDVYNEFVIIYDEDTRHQDNNHTAVKRKENELRSKIKVTIRIDILNPCFEDWLIRHFRESPKAGNCERVISFLKRDYIRDYDKNDYRLLNRHLNKEQIIGIATKYNCQTIIKHFIA